MKVSDEIRNWCEFEDGTECGGFVTKASFNKILALADRIDAEMVELPRGKDGRPIHVGDTVYDEFPDALTVNSITLSDCYARVKASGKRAVYDGLDPERLTHTRPDSFERIADEIERYANDSRSEDEIDGMTASTLVDFAERIRKLAKKEDER